MLVKVLFLYPLLALLWSALWQVSLDQNEHWKKSITISSLSTSSFSEHICGFMESLSLFRICRSLSSFASFFTVLSLKPSTASPMSWYVSSESLTVFLLAPVTYYSIPIYHSVVCDLEVQFKICIMPIKWMRFIAGINHKLVATFFQRLTICR